MVNIAMSESDGSDACRRVIPRTYREMLAKGYSDKDAFQSAVNVYRIRHPEVTKRDAPYVVADLICEEIGE